jgi:PKD repeat protein
MYMKPRILTTLIALTFLGNFWAQPGPPSSGGGFGTNDTIGCTPHVTNFISMVPNAVAWDWNFGNGTTSTQQNPTAVYTSGGTYTVTLDVTLQNGSVVQFDQTDYITVVPKPVIDLTMNGLGHCLNNNVVQIQNNTTNASQHLWDFNDGNMSTAADVNHTYIAPGGYSISYFATNALGCISDTTISNVMVYPVAPSNFGVVGPTTSCDSSHVFSFAAQPPGLASYAWEFSDGSQSSGPSIQHVFNSYNSFDAQLITTDQNGCMDTTFTANVVSTLQASDDFTVSATNSCQLMGIAFQSIAPGASSIHWDFGDGQMGTGANAFHHYQNAGQYTVTMVTTRPGGCGQTVVKTNLISITQPSTATALVSDTTVCAGEPIDFTAVSSNAQNVEWQFGDGNSSTLSTVTHQYAQPGQYIALLIHNAGGCNDTVQTVITVSQPVAAFQNTTFSNCAPADFQFSNNSIGAVSWEWSFSDGQTSQLQDPLMTFTTAGYFDAQLIAYDQNGCADTSFVANAGQISSNTPQGFQSGSFVGCSPFSVSFYDYSMGAGNWNWDFGDGFTSTLSSPNHTYYTPGDYVVSLNTIDSSGCGINIDTFAIVTVNSVIIDSLSISLNCDSLEVDYAANCPDCSSGYWTFGDGTTSTQFAILKEYGSEGPFDVSFTGFSDMGCIGTSFVNVNLDSCLVHVPNSGMNVNTQSPVTGDGDGWVDNPVPNDTLIIPAYEYCGPITISIINPRATAQSWVWHFGDGNTDTAMQPYHTYDSLGLFSIMLEFDDGTGWDTLYYHHFIQVNGHTNTIEVTSLNGCNNLEVNLASQDTSLVEYYWSLDGQAVPNVDFSFDTLFSNGNQLHSIVLTTLDDNFCSYSTSAGVISQGLDLSFAYDSTICLGDTLSIAHNLPNSMDLMWSFGSVTQADSSDYLFTHGGHYDIAVEITDANGCSFLMDVGPVNVTDVNSDFGYNAPAVLCVGDTIRLSAMDLNNDSYDWDLNNVTMLSGGPNAMAIVDAPGTYNVGLEATLNGCVAETQYDSVYAVNEAVADFSFVQDNLCLPVATTFTDLSVNPVSWDWDFADGSGSQLQHPSHVFTTQPGGQVALTITDANGCSATVTKNNIDLFSADVNISSSTGCAPAPITFTDNSQNGVDWSWTFGDGNTSTAQSPTHIYTTDGVYDVSLIVVSADGCTDTVVHNGLVEVDRVEANFVSSASTGCAPQPAYFTDNSYNATSWQWNFGNGASSNIQDPIQIYYAGGNYDVELIVESATGCTDTMSSSISIMGPLAAFELSDTIYCEGDSIELINHSQSVSSVTWMLGDGTTSNDFSPVHDYGTSGNYTITLIAVDANGCQNVATETHNLTIEQTPVAAFTISDTVGCDPLPVNLMSNNGGYSYQWQVNGSAIGSGANYGTTLGVGSHSVTLVAESANGCLDSTTIDNIVVHPVYNVALNPLNDICETQDTVVVGSSVSIGDWYLDGVLNPSNIFDVSALSPGDYTIKHKVDTYCGSEDTVVLHIDSMVTASINPPQVACETDEPFYLTSSSTVGYWSGIGIVDPFTGQVDPAMSNHGVNPLVYTIVNGSCTFMDTTELIVNRIPEASFAIQGMIMCEGQRFEPVSSSAGTLAMHSWVFTNGNDTILSSENEPSILLEPGLWDISLEVSNNGCEGTASIQDIQVFDNKAPHTPEIVRSTVVDNNAVLTEWEDPKYGEQKITGFEIWRSLDSLEFSYIETVNNDERSFVDYTTDVDNQNYYYMVVPTNVCNVKPEENAMSSSILLKVEDLGDDHVKFTWSEYYKWKTGVDYYELQRKNEFGVWETIRTIDGDNNSIIIDHP